MVKLCRKLNEPHHEPPIEDDWSTWIDYQIVPGDCTNNGPVTCALEWSTNLQTWQTAASLTYTGAPVNVRVGTVFHHRAFYRIIVYK